MNTKYFFEIKTNASNNVINEIIREKKTNKVIFDT